MAEALVRDRTQAIQFPGKAAAEYFTRRWHEKTNAPLAYVTGDELAANSIAVYSKDRPRVVVHGTLEYAPWIDIQDVRRKGIVVVWTDGGRGETYLPRWERNFGFKASETSVIELPMQSYRPKTVRLRYAIVPPRP